MGHCLELKRSTRATTSREENDKKKANLGKPSTKILVRNIPFQAKKEEISQLFRTFGELSAIRLPRKMAGTGDHRGFAFIDFSNVSDAKTAFKSSSTALTCTGGGWCWSGLRERRHWRSFGIKPGNTGAMASLLRPRELN